MEDVIDELLEHNAELFSSLNINIQDYTKLMKILSSDYSSAMIKKSIKKENIKYPEKIIITIGFLGARNLLVTSINTLIDEEKVDIEKVVTDPLDKNKFEYLNLFLNFHTSALNAKVEDKLVLFLLSVHSLDSANFCTKVELIEFIYKICIQNKIAIEDISRSYYYVIDFLSLEEKNKIDSSLIN